MRIQFELNFWTDGDKRKLIFLYLKNKVSFICEDEKGWVDWAYIFFFIYKALFSQRNKLKKKIALLFEKNLFSGI